MTTELARIETITPAELFKPGALDPILGRIREEVMREAACLDISTEPNRKALASLAFKVAKSKTFIDAQRKKLVSAEKERLKAIDQEGGRIWDELEKLQAEVRKPLTDWENAEKERVARHEANLQELIGAGVYTSQNWESLPLEAMRDRLKEILVEEYDWEEFQSRAVAAVRVTIAQIKEAIARREKLESERAELEKLRAAQALRDQQEREERIAREAKEKAEWEAKRREEAAATAAEASRKRVEDERNAAEARAKQAEAQKAQLERQAEEAKAKAVRDQEAAVAAEQLRAAEAQRVAAEASAKATADALAAQEKREANKRHCAKINREVRDALVRQSDMGDEAINTSLSKAQAEWIVNAIAAGVIPHTKITY